MRITDKQITLLKYIQSLFSKPVYLVGGAVRDIALNIEPKDYDFCSSMTSNEVKEALKGKHRAYLIGEKFGTVGFKVDRDMIEITTFRKEEYKPGSRHPKVEFTKDIISDLSRRDFTINAMAIRCDNLKVIDPFGGQEDLEDGILRTVGDSKCRFKEDPLRILRAVRISSKYALDIEDKTYDRCCKMANKLLEISKERWCDELNKILMLDSINLANGIYTLWDTKIFNYILPELSLQDGYNQNSRYHDYSLSEHTCRVVASTPKDLKLRWAALLHDIAKPFVRTENKNGYSNYINHEILGAEMADKIGRYLKWSNDLREGVVDLIRNHLNDDCELRQYDNLHKTKNND